MQVNHVSYGRQSLDYNAGNQYFTESFDSWIEKEAKAGLTDSELKDLKSKYNSDNMSDKENIDLLGELVELGILTKSEAFGLYYGIVQLPADFVLGQGQPVLEKYSPDAIENKPKDQISDWLSYYKAMLAKNLEHYNSDKGSAVVGSYQEYVDILAKLAAGR